MSAKKLKNDPELRLANLVQILESGAGTYPKADLPRVPRSELMYSVEGLIRAEGEVRRFRHRIEAILDGTRTCASCDAPIAGRSDKRYCSSTCRKRGSRSSRSA